MKKTTAATKTLDINELLNLILDTGRLTHAAGLVSIAEVRKLGGLSREALHEALLAAEKAGLVDLKIGNDPRRIPDLSETIRRGEGYLQFVVLR